MTEMQIITRINEYKEKVPAKTETKLECITYLMLFMDLYKADMQEFREEEVFDTLYDIPQGALQMFCSGIKYFANEGAVQACIAFFKDQIKAYSRVQN